MHDSTTESKGKSWLVFIPVALLFAVWMIQVVLTQVDHLTPWKGAGFGMFSVTTVRDLNIEADDAHGRTLIIDPMSFEERYERLNKRVLYMPSAGVLCRVAQTLFHAQLVEVAWEQSVQFTHNQRRWWRVKGLSKGQHLTKLSKRSDRVLMLADSTTLSPEGRPQFRPRKIEVSVMRTQINSSKSQLTRGVLGATASWENGRCEIRP